MDSVPAPAEKDQPHISILDECERHESCDDCPLDENCPWEYEDADQ